MAARESGSWRSPFSASRGEDPEIITPEEWRRREQAKRDPLSDENLERLVALLDDGFEILGIRFGLDPIIGLFPGIGDVIAGLASLVVVVAGFRRGLPKVTIARMVANIAIDTLLGTVPVVGDAFDIYWKSNRKNLNLLQRARGTTGHEHSWRDWLFFSIIVLILTGLALLPIVALVWLVSALRS